MNYKDMVHNGRQLTHLFVMGFQVIVVGHLNRTD